MRVRSSEKLGVLPILEGINPIDPIDIAVWCDFLDERGEDEIIVHSIRTGHRHGYGYGYGDGDGDGYGDGYGYGSGSGYGDGSGSG